MRSALGVVPGGAGVDVHGQLDLQAGGGLHLFLQNGGGPLRLGGGRLHDELVVHLRDQAGLQPLGGQPVRSWRI